MKNLKWDNNSSKPTWDQSLYDLSIEIDRWGSQFSHPLFYARFATCRALGGKIHANFEWKEFTSNVVYNDILSTISFTYFNFDPAMTSVRIHKASYRESHLKPNSDDADNLNKDDLHAIFGATNKFCAENCLTVNVGVKYTAASSYRWRIYAIASDVLFQIKEVVLDYIVHSNFALSHKDFVHPQLIYSVVEECKGIYAAFGALPTERFMRAAREHNLIRAIEETDKIIASIDDATQSFLNTTWTSTNRLAFDDAKQSALSLGRKI